MSIAYSWGRDAAARVAAWGEWTAEAWRKRRKPKPRVGHGVKGCTIRKCGGVFRCYACKRYRGWCDGAAGVNFDPRNRMCSRCDNEHTCSVPGCSGWLVRGKCQACS